MANAVGHDQFYNFAEKSSSSPLHQLTPLNGEMRQIYRIPNAYYLHTRFTYIEFIVMKSKTDRDRSLTNYNYSNK